MIDPCRWRDVFDLFAEKMKKKGQIYFSTLEAITQAISTINQMNTMIASASGEQSATAEEMNKNLSNIHALAEHNATGAAQTTGSSEELARLAVQLQEMVGQFKIH